MSLNASSWQTYCTKCEKFCCTALNGGCIFQLNFSIGWKALRDVDYHGVCQWTGLILLGEKNTFFFLATHILGSLFQRSVLLPEIIQKCLKLCLFLFLSLLFPFIYLFLYVRLARENSMDLKVSAKCFTQVYRQLADREASRTVNGRLTCSFKASVE